MVGLTAQVISPCQATVIHDLFVAGTLPPDLGQLVMFTIEMRVVGQLSSGGEIDSDKFRFSVRTCIGCLQTGFQDVAQYDFPARPTCSALTTPNLNKGNPCNPAQDRGPLLCCTGTGNAIVCPAPGAPACSQAATLARPGPSLTLPPRTGRGDRSFLFPPPVCGGRVRERGPPVSGRAP